jgi:hypothetical protein
MRNKLLKSYKMNISKFLKAWKKVSWLSKKRKFASQTTCLRQFSKVFNVKTKNIIKKPKRTTLISKYLKSSEKINMICHNLSFLENQINLVTIKEEEEEAAKKERKK